MIDIGANLTSPQFRNNVESILKDSFDNNIDQIIVTGTSINGSYLSSKLVDKYPEYNLYFTVGIHPHEAKEFRQDMIPKLKKMLEHPKAVAIGECGLDYSRNYSKKEDQLRCFEEHIKLAIELDRPMFLHERDAVSDFLTILDKHPKVMAVVHCFTGNTETIQKYLDRGYYIGITGWICDDKRNKDLLEAIKLMPLDRLMIETDSPFLTPLTDKKEKQLPNVPKNLTHILNKLAEVLNISFDELRKITVQNTINFFSLKN